MLQSATSAKTGTRMKKKNIWMLGVALVDLFAPADDLERNQEEVPDPFCLRENFLGENAVKVGPGKRFYWNVLADFPDGYVGTLKWEINAPEPPKAYKPKLKLKAKPKRKAVAPVAEVFDSRSDDDSSKDSNSGETEIITLPSF